MCSARDVADAFLSKQHHRNNYILHQSGIDRTALIYAFNRWNLANIAAMRLMVQERPHGQPMSLLLYLAVYAQASYPRDRVYGLLGLVSEAFLDGLTINYLELSHDTFRRAMGSMLVEEGPRCLIINGYSLFVHGLLTLN